MKNPQFQIIGPLCLLALFAMESPAAFAGTGYEFDYDYPGHGGDWYGRMAGPEAKYDFLAPAIDLHLSGDDFGAGYDPAFDPMKLGPPLVRTQTKHTEYDFCFTNDLATAPPTCSDVDRDSYGSPGDIACPGGALTDCDDANPAIFPTASQVCDGLNNDCGHPSWPGLAGTNEADNDGDTLSACQGDCDDTNIQVWATPGEALNLLLTFNGLTGVSTLGWNPPLNPGGTSAVYDTLGSDNPANFVLGAFCVESDDGLDTMATYSQLPPQSIIRFFVIRTENACPFGVGSIGTDSNGVERAGRLCP